MSNSDDALPTGALFLGASAAALAFGQWFISRSSPDVEATSAPTASAPAMLPATATPEAPTMTATPSAPRGCAGAPRNAKPARGARRYTREGRTIQRDGVAVLSIARVDLGDQRYAITPHETDVLVEQIVRLLNGTGDRRQSRAPSRRDARAKDPKHRQRWLVDERCGYRALLFSTGAPPETAVVGDVWVYLERLSTGEILRKRRFRTTDEGYRYIKAALRRTLERAGKHDCYDY